MKKYNANCLFDNGSISHALATHDRAKEDAATRSRSHAGTDLPRHTDYPLAVVDKHLAQGLTVFLAALRRVYGSSMFVERRIVGGSFLVSSSICRT